MLNCLIYGVEQRKNRKHLVNRCLKAHIDLSLSQQWNSSDFLILTDFPFEYRGVSSTVFPPHTVLHPYWYKHTALLWWASQHSQTELPDLWFHDLDTWSLVPKQDVVLTHFNDIAFVNYRGKWNLNTGVIYWRGSTLLNNLQEFVDHLRLINYYNDEKAWASFWLSPPRISRCTFVGSEYNFSISNTSKIVGPVKIWHFHPETLYKWRLTFNFIKRHSLFFPQEVRRMLWQHFH
jgi:hypothetical protein